MQSEENDDEMAQQKGSKCDNLDDDIEASNFDITSFINDPTIEERKIKAGVKKIDMQAQKYIVEEGEEDDDEDENVDIETVEDCENSPVLQAGDLKSLLEQFEATEMPEVRPVLLEETEIVEEKKESLVKGEFLDFLDCIMFAQCSLVVIFDLLKLSPP